MKQTTTHKLIAELNKARGLTYPEIGYSLWCDVKGDGVYSPRVYTIINADGGVTLSDLNDNNPRQRCQKIRDAIKESTMEKTIETINTFCAQQLEYEESDAGDNYAHMPAESWDKESTRRMAEQFEAITESTYDEKAGWSEVVKYPAIDTKGLELDKVADIALQNFTMRQGSIYGMYDSEGWIELDAYMIGEIEIELDSLGLDYADIMAVESACEPYIAESGRAYLTTDAGWFAAIKRVDLQQLIDAETELDQ